MAATDRMAKLLYVVVVEDYAAAVEEYSQSFRYTRSVLQNTLQLMGCKARHAFKISQRVFEMMRHKSVLEKLISGSVKVSSHDTESETKSHVYPYLDKEGTRYASQEEDKRKGQHFELYKRQTTMVVEREVFLDVVCKALSEYKYMGPNQRADLVLACRIRERKESVTVLLCGTSGCGKSTLSALLASRLGITTVVSTDSIRHMMRSFVDEEQNPLLWASTYHAGERLDPVAVAKAKAKKKAKKLVGVSAVELVNGELISYSTHEKFEGGSITSDMISPKQMAIEGFKAQSEMVIDSLDRLITSWEERKESVVVEGVHLSLNFVMGLMKKHPSVIPFMIYISNEEKHLERFAVRAKYMTLDPARNKYVKYIRNIRTIQDYLCKRADKHLVPKINNTNVDKSVAAIHATVFSCLRRREVGEHLFDPATNTVFIVDEEYRNQCTANSLSSKGMFQLIQRQDSTRHMMALLNDDGSVAKAWPLDIVDDNGKPIVGHAPGNGIGSPMYGPLRIGKAEPVNLQFGLFGISAWPSDTGGTSHTSSIDVSRDDLTDNGSRYISSSCSSPRMSDGPAKELKEEQSVHGSDEEEIDDAIDVDSDDGEKLMHEELGGSVDESTQSEEDYNELATEGMPNGGYITDDDEQYTNMNMIGSEGGDELNKTEVREEHGKRVEQFQRARSEPLSESRMHALALNERKVTRSRSYNSRRHSRSTRDHRSLVKVPTIIKEAQES